MKLGDAIALGAAGIAHQNRIWTINRFFGTSVWDGGDAV